LEKSEVIKELKRIRDELFQMSLLPGSDCGNYEFAQNLVQDLIDKYLENDE